MKKSFAYLNIILLIFLLQNCREEDPATPGKVQFAFSASDVESPGGRTQFDLATLYISINQSNGSPLHTLKELALTKFGDEYISEPLALPPANYSIIDFLVADVHGTIVYASPKEGSPLASLVEHPLPISFGVSENEVTDLGVEVVATNAHQPEEFGYATFSIVIVPTEAFQLSVFIPGENGMEFSGAQAYILHENDTVYAAYLPASVNRIFLNENPDDSITLVLIEPSYKKYSRTFTINTLQEELMGDPLAVCLLPALTFTAVPYSMTSGYIFDFVMHGTSLTSGDLSVDWGDGSTEDGSDLSHTYATEGSYFVSVSGDLEAIEYLYIYYTHVDDVSVRHLSKLQELNIGGGTTPAFIDLSHNPELRNLNFAMGTFTSIDISNNPLLNFVGLEFNSGISADEINALVDLLYQRATENNITGGYIGLIADWDHSLIGPPSEASLDKIRKLRRDYGWFTYPEDF